MTCAEKDNVKKWEQTVWFWMGRLARAAVIFIVLTTFLCRLSEVLGYQANRACLAALMLGAVSGVFSGMLMWQLWSLGGVWITAGFFIAGVIRLLIVLAGVVIIRCFNDISLPWFFGWLAVFYTVFMAMDIWFMVCLMRDYQWTARDF